MPTETTANTNPKALDQRDPASGALNHPTPASSSPIVATAATNKKPFSEWRKRFHALSELEQGDMRMLIEGIMPEGVNFLGSLAGVGKTWVALSMARALVTGGPFLGLFKVPVKIPVLYLVPEMGARAFRKRCEKMKLPPEGDMFLCRTMRDGLMKLDDPYLRSAIEDLKPVVFLDSAIRFQVGEESSASANATGLAASTFNLLCSGAQAVLCLHHSPKFSAKDGDMTLENVLRGTSDLGAMADAVWGLEPEKRRKGKRWDIEYLEESKSLTRLTMKCVKSRDFEPAEGMVIQGRPTIDERGDFEVVSQAGADKPESSKKVKDERTAVMVKMIQDDPTVSCNKIIKATGWNSQRLKEHAGAAGYQRSENGWLRLNDTTEDSDARLCLNHTLQPALSKESAGS